MTKEFHPIRRNSRRIAESHFLAFIRVKSAQLKEIDRADFLAQKTVTRKISNVFLFSETEKTRRTCSSRCFLSMEVGRPLDSDAVSSNREERVCSCRKDRRSSSSSFDRPFPWIRPLCRSRRFRSTPRRTEKTRLSLVNVVRPTNAEREKRKVDMFYLDDNSSFSQQNENPSSARFFDRRRARPCFSMKDNTRPKEKQEDETWFSALASRSLENDGRNEISRMTKNMSLILTV